MNEIEHDESYKNYCVCDDKQKPNIFIESTYFLRTMQSALSEL